LAAMMKIMKKYFLTGLVTLLPLTVTVVVVIFFIHLLTKPFMGPVSHLLMALPIRSEMLIRVLSQILILASLFLITLGLGMVAHRFFFKAMMKFGDRLVHKIPIVNKVYKTIKEIFQTLLEGEKKSFQQVVMMPYPRPGAYVLGFVSHDAPKTCSESAGEELVSVFLPATPNPMTGCLVIRPKSELIKLDMRSEDALKYIVSCGVVPAESAKEDE
jgi:uncharacterized membrane protein